jgi:hypothetical protein
VLIQHVVSSLSVSDRPVHKCARTVTYKFCTSSWSLAKIVIRCTVSETLNKLKASHIRYLLFTLGSEVSRFFERVCLCECVRECVRVCVRVCACVRARARACVCVCARLCVFLCLRSCTFACVFGPVVLARILYRKGVQEK